MEKVLLLILSTFYACNLATAQEKQSWTPEDVVNQESASNFEFSPNGKLIVWQKRRPSKEKDRFVTDLYLTRLDIKEKGTYKTILLTQGEESEHAPFFSKDGATIYFLSSREEGKKLWGMSVYGGEPYEVHTFENGISSIQWLGEEAISFTAGEKPTLYEQKLKELKDNVMVIEDTAHFDPTRVFSFNFTTKKVKRLTNNTFPIMEYATSENGKYLVTSHVLSPHYRADANPKPIYYIWDLEKNTKTQILKEGYQTPGRFTFTKDNSGFYFTSEISSDPEWNGAGISVLHFFDLKSMKVTDVNLDWDWGLGGGFDLVQNDVVVSLANGTTNKLAYLTKKGTSWTKKPIQAGAYDEHLVISAFNKDFTNLVYVYSTASTPPQFRLGALKNNRRKVEITPGEEFIKLNANLLHKKITKTETISWAGANDDEVTGILYYPYNYKEGRKYPLIVATHGGPSGVNMDRWQESWAYYSQLLAEKGAFVLNTNYHGSSNHGLEFVESIKGHYYDLEMIDITNGIHLLEKQGKIDMDSLGAMGWSNGAILTTMLTVRFPDMFKVATPGAGDVNWTSDFGTCAFGVSFDQSYFEGAPWDDRDGNFFNMNYIIKSPLFEMEKVKTPTLIFHGSEDRAVPRDQGWEYYRALQQIDKAPVRFLWFPGQPHGPQKITHRLRKMKEEIRWFNTYLWKSYSPENEAYKKESPLAELLQKQKSAQENGLFGLVVKRKLIPEVLLIKKDSTSIGRFEVTNAQYKAWKTNHDFIPIYANQPVTGITRDEAIAYTKWLSSLTGESYRLPNNTEAEALQKSAKKIAGTENVLNYWAGYELSALDIRAFRDKLDEVHYTMLMSVGSFKGTKVGEATIYDLGGNAAEYFTGNNNKVIYGYSAISYVDDFADAERPIPSYIGFRVIKN